MTAVKLDVFWDHEQTEALKVVLALGPARSGQLHRCPSCNSIIYSRRNRKCAVCEQDLPHDLLFSVTEARRIKQMLVLEQQRHRAWLTEVDRG